MQKLSKLFFLLFVYQIAFSQEIDFKAKDILVANPTLGNGTMWYYPNKILMKTNVPSTFDKNSPEQVFYNFFTITTKKQLQDFFSENIPKSYAKENYVDLMKVYFKNTAKNYYELDSKIEFDNGVKKSIIIKYINHNEAFPKPIASVIYLELDHGIWKIKDMGENFELALFFICTKSKVLSDFFSNQLPLDQKKILSQFITNDRVDFKKLIDTFFELKKENNKHPLIQLLYDNEYSIF